MKHRPRPTEQDDLLRPRLVYLIDMRHELATLAALIDWKFFEREWADFVLSATGRRRRRGCSICSTPSGCRTRPSSRAGSRTPYWRRLTGEEGVEWLLTKTIKAGRKSGAVEKQALDAVACDTTGMES